MLSEEVEKSPEMVGFSTTWGSTDPAKLNTMRIKDRPETELGSDGILMEEAAEVIILSVCRLIVQEPLLFNSSSSKCLTGNYLPP